MSESIVCRTCELPRTPDDFRMLPSGKRDTTCKDCVRAYNQSYYQQRREELKQRTRERYRRGGRRLSGKRNQSDFSSSTGGAAAELLVCADLLLKGFGVFRSVSPTCSCDLVALKDDKLARIEVKSGYRTIEGFIRPNQSYDASKYDILAVVVGAEIAYFPDLD